MKLGDSLNALTGFKKYLWIYFLHKPTAFFNIFIQHSLTLLRVGALVVQGNQT